MAGPINAGIGLARQLIEKGHEVIYMGIADCQPIITANHFEFISVYNQLFPLGWINEFYKILHEKGGIEAYSDIVKFVNFLMQGGDNELFQILSEIKPDLILISASEIDSIIWALLAYKAGIKTVYLFDVLGGQATITAPPIHTGIIADGKLISYLKISFAWFTNFLFINLTYLHLAFKKIDFLTAHKIKKLARYCNCPIEHIDFFTDMPNPLLKIPQLALFPEEFEFPKVNRSRRIFGDAAIDLSRRQAEFPWQRLRADTPLIYTALSTLPLLDNQQTRKFFQTVIDAASAWPEYDWVISVGNTLDINDFANITPNIILVNRAPQLDLLKKASLMITHGGPSSIKECIYFGVPLIAFPLWFDQAGNVARVKYYGLGMEGDFKTLSVLDLQDMIRSIFENKKIKNNLLVMQNIFRDKHAKQLSTSIIERLLSQ